MHCIELRATSSFSKTLNVGLRIHDCTWRNELTVLCWNIEGYLVLYYKELVDPGGGGRGGSWHAFQQLSGKNVSYSPRKLLNLDHANHGSHPGAPNTAHAFEIRSRCLVIVPDIQIPCFRAPRVSFCSTLCSQYLLAQNCSKVVYPSKRISLLHC